MTHPSPPNTRASSSEFIRGCKFDRRDIDRLWAASEEGFVPTDFFSVSTKRGESVTISASGITDLVDEVQRSTEPGDPDVFESLTLHVSSFAPRRQSIIIIRSAGVHVSVEGEPNFVRARSAKLTGLVRDAQQYERAPWFWPPFTHACYGTSLFALAWLVLSVIIDLNFSATDFARVLLIYGCFGIACWILGRGVSRKAATQIWMLSGSRPESYWRMKSAELLTIIVALLAVAVAVVSIWMTHTDASKTPGPPGPSPSQIRG